MPLRIVSSLRRLAFAAIAVCVPSSALAQPTNNQSFVLAMGAGLRDCDQLLAGANAHPGKSRLVPPEGKRFAHAISWRELLSIPGVEDAPWKTLERQHIEPLTLAAVRFNVPRVVAYIHFLDKSSPWLVGRSASVGWAPPSSWERESVKVKDEITKATQDALRKFLNSGGTVKYVPFKVVNPYYRGDLGFAQFEHHSSTPFPNAFMADEVTLDPSMIVGIDTVSFEFSRQVIGGDVGVGGRFILFNKEPFTMNHAWGATRLVSAGRAPSRDCLIGMKQ